MLEYNNHVMHLMNLSLNNPMALTCYLVKPRHPITTVDLPNSTISIGGGGTSIPLAATVFKDLIDTITNQSQWQRPSATLSALNPNTTQAINGTNQFPGQPSTSALPTTETLGITSPGESLFNQKFFVERFKVLKTRKFTLQPGKRATLSLKMPHRMISFSMLSAVNTTGANPGTWAVPTVLPATSRMWLVSFHGTPAPYLTKLDGTGNFTAFDCPAALLGMYHTEQWCIRQYPAGEYQQLAYRVTAAQDLTGALGPVSFGRVTKVGETVNAGSGATVANIAAT